MTPGKVQGVLSIIVVSAFVGVTAIVALTPILAGTPFQESTEHLKTFSSVYSGIVGIIIGFYFGKTQSSRE